MIKEDIEQTTDEIIEQRCHSVLTYLYPGWRKMNIRQYNNAFDALKTIYYGDPQNNLKTKQK